MNKKYVSGLAIVISIVGWGGQPATGNIVDFTGGTAYLLDGSTFVSDGSTLSGSVDYYVEDGVKIDYIGGRGYIGPYYGVFAGQINNDVIHGHWGILDEIRISMVDGSLFSLNSFELTSNTITGGGPATGLEEAYINAPNGFSVLLPPNDWGFSDPNAEVFLDSNFVDILWASYTVTNDVYCFGMDLFYFNESFAPGALPSSLPSGSTGYWDINGENAGVGGSSPHGSWQGANWSLNPDGTSPTLYWTDGADAVFSVGNDATGRYTVDLDAPVVVRDLSVLNGQVTVAPSATLNKLTFTDPRDSESTITTENNSSLALDAEVLATGSLAKEGLGRLDFNAPTEIAGIFSIREGVVYVNSYLTAHETKNSGTLMVNGSLTSSVYNSGFLGGSGRINGNVQNTGIVSPGNSIGTLTINGSYTHSSSAVYLAEIGADGRSDLLNISGNAVLNGGTVSTSLPPALYTDGFSWNILRAGGGVVGGFSSLQGQPNSATLDLELVSSGKWVDIQVQRTSYGTFATTLGDQATGVGLDMLVPLARNRGDAMESMLIGMDFGSSAQQIGSILTALSPEMYTSFVSTASQTAQSFTKKMTSRSADVREVKCLLGDVAAANIGTASVEIVAEDNDNQAELLTEQKWKVWGYYDGTIADREKSQQYLGYSATSGGVFVGLDRKFLPELQVGASFGAVSSDLEWERSLDSGDQNTILAGVYASYGIEGFYFESSLSYATYTNEAKRTNPISPFLRPIGIDFDGNSWLASIGGGYDFLLGNWIIGPAVSLGYLYVGMDDFQEYGGDFLSMNIKSESNSGLITSLGVSAATLMHAGKLTLLPRLEVAWRHDTNGDEYTLQAAFRDYPNASFSVPGAGAGKDILAGNIGITALISDVLSGHVQLGSDIGEDCQNLTLSGGVTFKF